MSRPLPRPLPRTPTSRAPLKPDNILLSEYGEVELADFVADPTLSFLLEQVHDPAEST